MNFADEQNYYASVIERLGWSVLPNGKTLSEEFTINEIPFWDVFSSEMAWRHLATSVAATTTYESAKLLVKPYFLRLKDWVQKFSDTPHRDRQGLNHSDKPTILCLAFSPRMYRDVLEPVVERLTAKGDFNVVVLSEGAYPSAVQNRNKNVSFQLVEQNWGVDEEQELHLLRQAVRRLKDEFSDPKVLKQLYPKNDRRITKALKKVFYLLLNCYMPLILRQAVIAKHLLKSHRPNLVLSPDTSDARARMYVQLSKKLKIPSMEVQFGITGDEGVEWRFFSADCVAVWGKTSKMALLKQNVPEEKIIITGSPRYDFYSQQSHSAISLMKTEMGIKDGRPVILLASTYTDKTHKKFSDPKVLREMKQAIFHAAEKYPDVTLLVKPHPCEDVEETRGLAGNSTNIIMVNQDSDIRNLIMMCDAFFSFGSTATIDAMIAGKISICPIFPGWPFSEPFRVAGVVITPESSTQIEKIFSDMSIGNNLTLPPSLIVSTRKYLNDVVYNPDGLASDRICDQIVKLLYNSSEEDFAKVHCCEQAQNL